MNNDNKKKVELPVANPIITSYTGHASLLSVIQNNDESMPWILGNFIQILMYTGENSENSSPFFYRQSDFETCPCIDYQRIGRDIITKKWPNVIEFIIDCIDMGYYISVNLDQFFIKNSPRYQKEHIPHPTFIYGYDCHQEIFNIADFYNYGKFTHCKESFSNIKEAFDNYHAIFYFHERRFLGADDIFLFKIREEFDYQFSVKEIIIFLEDYLNSRNTCRRMPSYDYYHYSDSRFTFGINIYNVIKNRLETSIHLKEFIQPKYFYIFWDQKKLMLSRINYLGNHKHLDNTDVLYRDVKELEVLTRTLLNLGLKFNLTKDLKIIDRIISAIPILVEKEIKAMELLLRSLQDR
ncbi:hypothetical protein [Paenibacillus sonchi]|uniref:hypothetical protein n=1 Tax=Paenibacillus sonchi TaxID=373687 RepID=UPI001E28BE6A|nr:hypothetical protein [Paenibacillus sonchi]MCE3203129.1 hypothetical protein [Paenibacillus sonchi]